MNLDLHVPDTEMERRTKVKLRKADTIFNHLLEHGHISDKMSLKLFNFRASAHLNTLNKRLRREGLGYKIVKESRKKEVWDILVENDVHLTLEKI